MTTPRDPDRLIRAFLAEGQTDLPDRTYEAVRADIDRTRQPVVIGPWRFVGIRGIAAVAVAAGALVVTLVGISMLPASSGVGGPAASPSPTPSASRDPRLGYDAFLGAPFEPGWSHGRIRLAVPPGWYLADARFYDCSAQPCWSTQPGRTIVKVDPEGGGPTLSLNLAQEPTHVVEDVCDPTGSLREVGPSAKDLATALASQVGIYTSSPSAATVGGYPATKFVLTVAGSCLPSQAQGRTIWADDTTNGFGLWLGETVTVHIVDVNGYRLVITTQDRGSTSEDIAELDAIIASIQIDHVGTYPTGNRVPFGDLPIGRHSLIVEGVPLSFSVSSQGWERFGDISLNKSWVGPQGAEAIIYWTGFPDGTLADLCAGLLGLPTDSSAADLATAVSLAPGTELITEPSDVTVGERPAKFVRVRVREDLGCDPGYFYSWDDAEVGALWPTTGVGDTINLWIVDVNGARLFIAAETNRNVLEQEIQDIVDSIQFE